jgi:hypothetical protein
MVNKLLKMMAYFPNNVVVRTRVDPPPRKILAALSLDFMDLFVPPSHYIPDPKGDK